MAPRAMAVASSFASSSAAAAAALAMSCLFLLIMATMFVAARRGEASLAAGTVSGISEEMKASCRAVGLNPAGASGRGMPGGDMTLACIFAAAAFPSGVGGYGMLDPPTWTSTVSIFAIIELLCRQSLAA